MPQSAHIATKGLSNELRFGVVVYGMGDRYATKLFEVAKVGEALADS